MFRHVVTALRTLFGPKRQAPPPAPPLKPKETLPEPVTRRRHWGRFKVDQTLLKYRRWRRSRNDLAVESRRRNRR